MFFPISNPGLLCWSHLRPYWSKCRALKCAVHYLILWYFILKLTWIGLWFNQCHIVDYSKRGRKTKIEWRRRRRQTCLVLLCRSTSESALPVDGVILYLGSRVVAKMASGSLSKQDSFALLFVPAVLNFTSESGGTILADRSLAKSSQQSARSQLEDFSNGLSRVRTVSSWIPLETLHLLAGAGDISQRNLPLLLYLSFFTLNPFIPKLKKYILPTF